MKVVLFTHDPMLTLARSKEETIDLFGEDYFEEYSVEVPDDLAKELIATYEKLIKLSRQAGLIKDKHERENWK